MDTHTKAEWYEEPKPFRGIFARSDRWKARFGPLIYSIEKVAYKLKFFIKRVPVSERATFIKEVFGIDEDIFSNDFTAFESSSHVKLIRAILQPIYSHIAKDWLDEVEEYIDVLSSTNFIRCRDYFMKVLGRRMSGEMDTSLGNGLLNIVILCYIHYLEGGYRDWETLP